MGKWNLEQAAQDAALAKGEETARANNFLKGPVDPFSVIASEGDLIRAEGDDFRDCFDGRLSFHDRRFLLVYNTRYNIWPHHGSHHPKVRFTVAHELGHYYHDAHREFLVTRGKSIESFAEFESNKQVEREADAFATGLLMPEYLVAPRINLQKRVTLATIRNVAVEFDVSLTGMMVRWCQLSHFPCATLCVRDQRIQWGFVSRSFQQCGLWKARRGTSLNSRDIQRFVADDPIYSIFREGVGEGLAQNWLDGDTDNVPVREYYATIPYGQCTMVFIIAEEDDLPASEFGDD